MTSLVYPGTPVHACQLQQPVSAAVADIPETKTVSQSPHLHGTISIHVIRGDSRLGCAGCGLGLGALPYLQLVLALVQLGALIPGHMHHVQVRLEDGLQAAATTPRGLFSSCQQPEQAHLTVLQSGMLLAWLQDKISVLCSRFIPGMPNLNFPDAP